MAGDDEAYGAPFSLRLKTSERRQLDLDAGPVPVGEYIRSRLFASPEPRKRQFRRPVQDQESLSRVLAALGQSRLSNNMNQVAKAIHSGSLSLTPEAERELLQACSDIGHMRQMLVQALGLPPEVK